MHAAGVVSAADSYLDAVVAAPNKWLVLMEYFQDPVKLKTYMQANCADRLVDSSGFDIVSASYYVATPYASLDKTAVLKVCADTHGLWDRYHQCVALIENDLCIVFKHSGSSCFMQAEVVSEEMPSVNHPPELKAGWCT
jgi:hypothetical protein